MTNEEQYRKTVFKWVVRTVFVFMVIVAIALVIARKAEIDGMSPEEKIRIAEVEKALKSAKRGDFIIEKDGHVSLVWHYDEEVVRIYTISNISGTPSWDYFKSSSKIVKVVSRTDPAYPDTAVKFITQDLSPGSR